MPRAIPTGILPPGQGDGWGRPGGDGPIYYPTGGGNGGSTCCDPEAAGGPDVKCHTVSCCPDIGPYQATGLAPGADGAPIEACIHTGQAKDPVPNHCGLNVCPNAPGQGG